MPTLTVRVAMALSTSADAYNATERLYGVFEAETLEETKIQDIEIKNALEITGAEFVWDGPPPEAVSKGKKGKAEKKALKKATATPTEPQSQESTFKLKDVNITIPHGQLTAIVGKYRHGDSGSVMLTTSLHCRPRRLRQVVFARGYDRRDASHRRYCSLQGFRSVLPAERLDPECNGP